MARAIDRISLNGFKSIEHLEDFALDKLNVLIGANGAGKSNFADYFRMLRSFADENFQQFVNASGGGDGFLFLGPKVTPEITSNIAFGLNFYGFTLKPTASGSLLIASETTGYKDSSNTHGSSQESILKSIRTEKSYRNQDYPGVGHFIYEAVSSWTVYHFHDTSPLAPMRRDQSVEDTGRFRHDASNIAPFLLGLKEEEPGSYELIRDTVRLIAPFLMTFCCVQGKEEPASRLGWNGCRRGAIFRFNPINCQMERFGSSVLRSVFCSLIRPQR